MRGTSLSEAHDPEVLVCLRPYGLLVWVKVRPPPLTGYASLTSLRTINKISVPHSGTVRIKLEKCLADLANRPGQEKEAAGGLSPGPWYPRLEPPGISHPHPAQL